MMALRALFVLAFVVLTAGDVGSEELTLQRLWQMALKNHEALAIAEEGLQQAHLDIKRAYSVLLPSLTLESTYTRYSEEKRVSGFLIQPEDAVRFEARVSQTIYDGGKEWSLLRQAKKRLKVVRLQRDTVREAVLFDVSLAFFNLLKAEKEVEIRKASLKRAEEHLKTSRALFKVGLTTRVDLLRAETEVATKQTALIEAEAEVRDARALLKRLTGYSGELKIKEPAEEFIIGGTPEELFRLALENRKDYRQKLMEEEIAKEGIRYAKGEFLPSLSVDGVYTWRDQSPRTSFFIEDTLYGGLTIRLPLFEGGLRMAELRKARSILRQKELERYSLKRNIKLEITRLYNDMEKIASLVDALKKRLEFARENYRMALKQYRHGIIRSVDLVDAETLLVDAELSLMNARLDYRLAILRLKKSTGVLLEEALKRVPEERKIDPQVGE